MIRSIQNRISLLIAFIGLSMIIGILISRQMDRQRVELLLEKKKTESSVFLNQVVDFKSRSLTNFSYDYTYWDEMVGYTEHRDHKWAVDNIQVSLPTFEILFAWVYDTDLSQFYSACADSTKVADPFPLSIQEMKMLVSTGPYYHFFAMTTSGLLQISGGSIHPSSDPDRKTPPRGYFFVGRMWSQKYIEEIESFTKTDLSVFRAGIQHEPVDSILQDKFGYVNFKSLNGWNGSRQAYLRSSGTMTIARDFEDRTQRNLFILALLLILALGFVAFILIRMINRPLKYLISSLMSDNTESIGHLMLRKSEFGQIARLMNDFFIQKRKLVDEIEERIKIEKELILAKDRAEESDRLKTAFLNNLSHEIRTPMNAIVGFSELIGDPRITEQEKVEFNCIIRDSTNRLLGTITDLVSLSTIESGQEIIHEEQFNLNLLLQDLFTQIKHDIGSKPVTLNVDVALTDEHSFIITDRTKLNQILLNLLKNSMKFTRSGRIEFGYVIRHTEIEFFVYDTGIGIQQEKFEDIFARFQQADDSVSREYGGAGLGLPISKAYVELLGGRMWLKSEVGKGSIFYFTIPFKIPQ
jgi:signal transduction histidine kinase